MNYINLIGLSHLIFSELSANLKLGLKLAEGFMYTHRSLSEHLDKVTASFPILLIIGPRQVGKKTLLQHAQHDRTYVTLDDPMMRTLAKEEPALFLQRFKPPVIIDEIQYAPELLPHIKIAVDKAHQPNMFWLTGSQQFHLMKNVSESLAGRVGILKLQGLSQDEKFKLPKVTPFLPTPEVLDLRAPTRSPFSLSKIYEIIWRGSFPSVALHKQTDHNVFYSSYVQTYLQRDVRDLSRVGDELSFFRFLRAAAARSGQLINFSKLARDSEISVPTVKTWISILEASGLIYMLEPYQNIHSSRLIKAPKLYFLDTGLCAYLTGWTSPETLESGAMSGAILETYIVSELLKSYWHCACEPPFFFYRDKDMVEIDLLIVQDGKIHPLEFKKTSKPSKDVIKSFSALQKLNHPIGHGGVICMVDKIFPLTQTVDAIPISYL